MQTSHPRHRQNIPTSTKAFQTLSCWTVGRPFFAPKNVKIGKGIILKEMNATISFIS